MVSPQSVLFVTLDSCRFDTFEAADVPSLKSVAPLHEAQAPSHFTFASHAAMFVGFTPGVAGAAQQFLDPKFARLFRLSRAGHPGHADPGFSLEGRDIVHGFRQAGYRTLGTAAMGWFDPASLAAAMLIDGFDDFSFVGPGGVARQVAWAEEALSRHENHNVFLFINVGETHVPYYFDGAPWSADDNPCWPYQTLDRHDTCRERQRLCCEYADRMLAPLLVRFRDATVLVCGDHGDCWGENGLWEHGMSHPKTLTVPLLIRYKGKAVS